MNKNYWSDRRRDSVGEKFVHEDEIAEVEALPISLLIKRKDEERDSVDKELAGVEDSFDCGRTLSAPIGMGPMAESFRRITD